MSLQLIHSKRESLICQIPHSSRILVHKYQLGGILTLLDQACRVILFLEPFPQSTFLGSVGSSFSEIRTSESQEGARDEQQQETL